MQENYYQNMSNVPPQAPSMFSSSQIRQMARLKLNGKWKKLVPIFVLSILIGSLPSILMALLGVSTVIVVSPEIITGEIAMPAISIATWISYIYKILVSGALSLSMALITLKVLRDEDFAINTLAYGFKNFKQSFFTYICMAFYTMAWSIIFMIPAVLIMSFAIITGSSVFTFLGCGVMIVCMLAAVFFVMRYNLAYYVASDNPGMKARFALANSSRLMRGNIFRLVILMITFFGWAILASIPDGICAMFFQKYMEGNTAMIIPAIIFMIVAAIVSALLNIYIQTSIAVFYSAASGFFRTKNCDTPDPNPYTELTPENYMQQYGNPSGYGTMGGYSGGIPQAVQNINAGTSITGAPTTPLDYTSASTTSSDNIDPPVIPESIQPPSEDGKDTE